MIDIDGRMILEDGTVVCSQDALVEVLYQGKDLLGTFCSDPRDQEEWDNAARDCDSALAGPIHAPGMMFSGINWAQHWNTPEPYSMMDVGEHCLSLCQDARERDRVLHEMDLFEKNGMVPVIRHLIYCVDVWRTNGVLWGVGRGSSVCSFILHLIGVNRINPFDYDLDIAEWIK